MSIYPKKEILGNYSKRTDGTILCLDCVRKEADGGSPLLCSLDLLLKTDMDEDEMYFCDFCQMEIRPIDETPDNDEAEATS